MNPIRIDGSSLSLDDLRAIVYERQPVLPSGDAREKVNAARAVVDALVAEDKVAYAITTGVGKLSDVRIDPAQNRQLQINLIRSHAAGVGEPLSVPETRAMMVLRANSLAKGLSGVREQVIDLLCEMLTRGVHPVVPSQGSVGASGDLA
ncbi:MAG TPA: aromatic amino acid lyase, partial [Candidatus Angelobacter sp.]|nr:aromatic amino acid lyase [Candidatus Angelobacter sp.]